MVVWGNCHTPDPIPSWTASHVIGGHWESHLLRPSGVHGVMSEWSPRWMKGTAHAWRTHRCHFSAMARDYTVWNACSEVSWHMVTYPSLTLLLCLWQSRAMMTRSSAIAVTS